MSRTTGAHIALAAVIGLPTGFAFAALLPSLAISLLALNLALGCAWKLWGPVVGGDHDAV